MLTRSKVLLYYADDTTIYCSDAGVFRFKETLTNDLVALSAWIERNGLSMNMEKTQFMSLNRRGREKEVENLQIVVKDEVLVRCDNSSWELLFTDNSTGRTMLRV